MPKICKALTACPIGCKKNHSNRDIFQANLEREDSFENEDMTVKYFLNVGLEICQNKWKIIDQSIKNENQVILDITGLNSYSIKQDYSFIENPNIQCLHVSFEQLICRLNRKAIDELFMHIQKSRNLKILQILLNEGNCSKEDAISKGIIFEPIQGSLSNLERILFRSYLPQMNQQSFQCFERALIDPKKNSGNLKTFQLNLSECDLNEKAFASIAKILSYNRDTLSDIDIILVETDFQLKPPVNILGRAFSDMRNLKDINLEMYLVVETINSAAIDLKELFHGIKQGQIISNKEQSIRLIFENILVMACSQVGDCLQHFSEVSFNGPLSISSATDIGIALGKSSKLTNLTLNSERPELGLLLTYVAKFTRSLRELQITYSGKNIIFFKDLGNAISKNKTIEILEIELEKHKISFQSVQNIIKGVSQMEKVFQLEIHSISMGGEVQEFYSIFSELGKSQTLESVFLSASDVKINTNKIDPKQMYLPLYSMDAFQELNMQLGDSFEKKLTKKGTKELLKGLIGHPRASSFSITNEFEDIQNVGNEFGVQFEVLMFTTIAFYKVICPFLSFHPKQHLEDLYF